MSRTGLDRQFYSQKCAILVVRGKRGKMDKTPGKVFTLQMG